MKKIVLSVTAAVALSSFAIAGGDIAPVMPADNWSGFYVGVQMGGIAGNADVSIPSYPSSFGLDPDGVAGGIYAGYNWLLDNDWLIGIEVSGNFISSDDEGLSGNGTERYRLEQNWDAAILLRIGKVIDDTWMPYITGGAAWTELEASYPGTTRGSSKDTISGWTLGAGIEVKLSTNIHARIEYRHSDYGTAHFSNGGVVSNVDYKDDRIMFGISYRF